MTQSQITAARAELAVKQSAIQYEIGMVNAKIWPLKQERNALEEQNTKLLSERARLLRLENEMKKEGKWEG